MKSLICLMVGTKHIKDRNRVNKRNKPHKGGNKWKKVCVWGGGGLPKEKVIGSNYVNSLLYVVGKKFVYGLFRCLLQYVTCK